MSSRHITHRTGGFLRGNIGCEAFSSLCPPIIERFSFHRSGADSPSIEDDIFKSSSAETDSQHDSNLFTSTSLRGREIELRFKRLPQVDKYII